ncbi:guanine nucleotide-binding subunit alpha-12 isoform X2 [Labeo rohita]|uniref:Guanine nucleotide-binding subunit alpha-12 isoform X2 n=1 Tax=Labeo rohita TaxID=84645 RepID=A0A498MKB4_LABRO|nr:guanine nucleotide-binding subunit alpha-12 isoform X2 [Labeo rohita]
MQTQQAFQADLKELRDVCAEVRELVQVAQSLRADLNQVRGQNRSPVQPTPSQLCSPPGKLHESTPLAEDGNSAELPPPWPEPDVDLMNQSLESYSTSVPVSPRLSSAPTTNAPAFAPKAEPGLRPVAPYSECEYVYRGPVPTIPKFSQPDPSEFARLRIALKNLLVNRIS